MLNLCEQVETEVVRCRSGPCGYSRAVGHAGDHGVCDDNRHKGDAFWAPRTTRCWLLARLLPGIC